MRDLILRRTPKDFDIITSAELKEVCCPFSGEKKFPLLSYSILQQST